MPWQAQSFFRLEVVPSSFMTSMALPKIWMRSMELMGLGVVKRNWSVFTECIPMWSRRAGVV